MPFRPGHAGTRGRPRHGPSGEVRQPPQQEATGDDEEFDGSAGVGEHRKREGGGEHQQDRGQRHDGCVDGDLGTPLGAGGAAHVVQRVQVDEGGEEEVDRRHDEQREGKGEHVDSSG
ncbi:MAG TPA: hypothetical protein VGJ07_30085 [Rugosimonospora sp.]